jgi:hypothetical protein
VLAEFRERNHAVRAPGQSRLHAAASDSHEVDSSDSNDETDAPLGAQLTAEPLRSMVPIAKPINTRFYNLKAGWLDVIDKAKNKFRLHICTVNPFPTIEHDSAAAMACIVEAMADFQKSDLNAAIQLDEGNCHPPLVIDIHC